MDNDKLETEIRKALDARAHEVDVPVDLMTRTLQSARARAQPSLRDRLRARLDRWRMRLPVTGYPRWLYAGAAAATAVALFAIGAVVTRTPMTTEVTGSGGDTTGATRLDRAQDTAGVKKGATTSGGSARASRTQGAAGPDSAASFSGEPVPVAPGKFAPKIVRTAKIEVEVRSFAPAWERASGVASSYGGFITNSRTEQLDDKRDRGTITMRVPASKLDAALEDLRDLGTVRKMSTTGEDVAAQIVDIDARTRTLEAQELQFLDLLRQARGVPEILEVRRHLDKTRQEIESLKAQKDYYADQVQYATISATVFEEGAKPEDEPGDGVLFDAWDTAVRVGLSILAGMLVVLGGLIPLVVLGLATWAGIRVVRRKRSAG